jgi:hypothetical protein
MVSHTLACLGPKGFWAPRGKFRGTSLSQPRWRHKDDHESQAMETIERDRDNSICEGIRLGISSIAPEPLPDSLEELLRLLRAHEKANR